MLALQVQAFHDYSLNLIQTRIYNVFITVVHVKCKLIILNRQAASGLSLPKLVEGYFGSKEKHQIHI